MRFRLDVDYGPERTFDFEDDGRDEWPMLGVGVFHTAGRPPGNPELTLRIFDRDTGDLLAEESARESFEAWVALDCEDTASCPVAFDLELEVTRGARADVTWIVGLNSGAAAPWDSADTASEPPSLTLTLE